MISFLRVLISHIFIVPSSELEIIYYYLLLYRMDDIELLCPATDFDYLNIALFFILVI